MGMKIQEIENLTFNFSRLSELCFHLKEAAGIPKHLEHLKAFIELLTKGASPKDQELLSDLQQRVSTWHQVWERLGKEVDFRNAVGREAHAWSVKLLKLSKETEQK